MHGRFLTVVIRSRHESGAEPTLERNPHLGATRTFDTVIAATAVDLGDDLRRHPHHLRPSQTAIAERFERSIVVMLDG